MPRLGSISAKAAGRLNAKLAVLRGTCPQKSKMAAFNRREKDEGDHKNAEIPTNEINHPTNQAKRATGGVSKGGGIGKAESQFSNNQIDDKSMQGKKWPAGGDVSSKNPATGNTRMKGKIPAQGGQYGGGGRSTQ